MSPLRNLGAEDGHLGVHVRAANGGLDGEAAFGDTSVALRGLTLQYIDGPLEGATPVGAACAATQSLCWTTDVQNDAIDEATLPGSSFAEGVGYAPVGVAYDPVRNRIYVSDPLNKAIHVYNRLRNQSPHDIGVVRALREVRVSTA